MKRFLAILSMCILLIVGGVQTAEAQKAKAAKKLIELVTKGAKKAPKKNIPTKRTNSKQITPKPRPRITTETCSQCGGMGTVTMWNSYYGQYQTVKCTKCDGKGKVRHN